MKSVKFLIPALLLTACSQNKDMFDPDSAERDTKAQYSENFVKTFPNVNLNQNWDYSHKNPSYSLPSGTQTKTRTRAVSYTFNTTDEYEVDIATLSWLTNTLKEQKNNKALGSPFYMSVPYNSFTIVPIYQGQASSIWELHMVVDGVDIKVWEKSQDLWVKKKADQADWTKVHDVSNTELYRTTIGAERVKSRGYTFENLPVGANMYFYLTVTKVTNPKYTSTIGIQLPSLIGQMLSLQDCPHPSNIPEGNEVMIVGCEDSNTNSDWDMNDLVFMVYGKPDVPKPIEITEGTPITKKKTVRYMIEDLGATDDFDFNDIVIDVSDIWTSTPHYVNGKLDSWTDSDKRQEAVIRHLGGILPFKLTIGDTQLEEHAGVLDANPDEVYSVSGWDINAHNISVQVKQNTNSTVYNNVVFPKSGEVPMIIAVDPTVQWMNERQCVPESWFLEPKYEE